MRVKHQILKLRSEGKSYNEIVKILKCSKGTVAYHCNPTQKTKTINRTKIFRMKYGGYTKSKYDKLKRKIWTFYKTQKSRKKYNKPIKTIKVAVYHKYQTFIYRKGYTVYNAPFTVDDVLVKIGENPICYLTGLPIDLTKSSTYQLDHIIPVSRGGQSTLDNLGICTKRANQSKDNMTPEEFIDLCKLILTHNGYIITKK